MADEEDDDLVELTAEELASLRLSAVDVPPARGWSSPTFACHRHVSSCVLSCCCPCVQFGLNQRAAFGESCFKWALLWLLPLLTLYVLVDQYVAPNESAAEKAVQHVENELLASGPASGGLAVDRSTAFLYALPVGAALVGLVGAARRSALRRKYGIGGTSLGDWCCHMCCACCSLAKEAREIRRQDLAEVVAGAERDIHEPQYV